MPTWRSVDGKLFKYVKPAVEGLGSPKEDWKIVVPKVGRKEILVEAYDILTSGHMGVYKTYNCINERFYWPKLKYIEICEKLQGLCYTYTVYDIPDLRGPNGLMTVQPVVNSSWEMLSIDLMDPLPRTTKVTNLHS